MPPYFDFYFIPKIAKTFTTTAAATTARTQACASGNEQCLAIRSDSMLVGLVSKYFKMSPPQSSGKSGNGCVFAGS
jgi:hypothetical protein